MSAERPSEATVKALAKVLHAAGCIWSEHNNPNFCNWRSNVDDARAILASDWLAAHESQVRADRDREWQVERDRLADEMGRDAHLMRGTLAGLAIRQDRDALRALAPDVAGEGQEEGT